MFRSLVLALTVFIVGGAELVYAQTAKTTIYIEGFFGTSQIKAYAISNGNGYTGAGMLTAGNNSGRVYKLSVTSAAIIQGHYVRLEGKMSSPEGVIFTSFVLYGDTATGAIRLTYTGSNKTPVTQNTKGTVTIK